ncbi:retrovirus-related pol polyprotein from transposon TNT 1-94 [Tanacetum coccineum]|uniref:Retrovirus-related pol polyprotein from transposon TNT 1-94 n=1 Tax=Tanacetum coccineum TaxID=301880 RepID=A0ABQ4Y9S9_9ASTR
MIQNKLGCSIVSIRTDHGQEFDNEVQFENYYDLNGISHNFSAPRTPQSNGVVERKKSHSTRDDELVKEEAIEVSKTKTIGNDLKDISLENNQIINIKESKTHPLENVIGNLNQRTLRSQAQDKSNFFCFISTLEPKNINEALKDENWVMAMQEKLNQFKTNEVWELVPNPIDMTIIGTKWVYRNKLDENGVITRNKARLVAQGYNQQEGIDYEETYAPIARL